MGARCVVAVDDGNRLLPQVVEVLLVWEYEFRQGVGRVGCYRYVRHSLGTCFPPCRALVRSTRAVGSQTDHILQHIVKQRTNVVGD